LFIAKQLSKSYNSESVFKNVSLELLPGTITTMLGPSGTGKSTLLRILSLLESPDSGSIEIDGDEYAHRDEGSFAAKAPWPKLTIVFQQLHLWPHLTLRENIMLPLKLSGNSDSPLAAKLVDSLSMNRFIDRHPNEVSIGQRQLCAFVRAVCLSPRYLFLDEITSSLDVEYTAKLLACLRDLREQGVAILLTTHLIGFARKSADEVIFLESGGIVESGSSSIIDAPNTERFANFLSMVMEAR
jgi:ABC-type polar amino acid transport system ATPase subunit